MADIRRAEEMHSQSGPGWTRTVLTDADSGRGLPMRAERLWIEPGAAGPSLDADGEMMLYVIAGSGTVRVGDTEHAVEPESVIWLTRGDRVGPSAGPDGIEILISAAGEAR